MPAEITAKDTLVLNLPAVTLEQQRNAGVMTNIFTFVGTGSDGKQWNSQIEFNADSIFGEWKNNDFYNWDGSQGSGSFNFLRQANSDMVFYAYKEQLAAYITKNEEETTLIDVNGLINVYGSWRRVLIHAEIAAPAPDDTVYTDLGIAAVIANPLYGTTIIEGENDTYHLAFGITGTNMEDGTYLMGNMLKPELILLPADTIEPADANVVISTRTDGEKEIVLNMLSTENILYIVSMHTGQLPITDTVAIDCHASDIRNYALEYQLYYISGQATDYSVAIAIAESAWLNLIAGDTLTSKQLVMNYTSIADIKASALVRTYDAEVSLQLIEQDKGILYANLKGVNGTLYQVTMPIGFSYLPAAKDTVNIDCGEGVGRIDYHQGIGYIGLILYKQGVADAQVVFQNDMSLRGTFTPEYFDYEQCRVMEVKGDVLTFHDIKAALITLDSINDTLHITLDAVAINDTLYHMTAWMGPKRCLTGDSVAYSISANNNVNMVALRNPAPGEEDADIYHINFQRGVNEEGEVINDAEIWNFGIWQEDVDGVAGIFGYSDGTMDDRLYHTLYEDGVEIYLAPVAGTLEIEVVDEIVIPYDGDEYKTHIYNIRSEFVAENGMLYRLSGANAIICADAETGMFIELTEQLRTALNEALAEKGYRVEKILRNGQLIIVSGGKKYNVMGNEQ